MKIENLVAKNFKKIKMPISDFVFALSHGTIEAKLIKVKGLNSCRMKWKFCKLLCTSHVVSIANCTTYNAYKQEEENGMYMQITSLSLGPAIINKLSFCFGKSKSLVIYCT